METTNEMADLVAAVRRVQGANGKVNFAMMIEWKRGRGMRSCAEMGTERKRAAWLRSAMRALEGAGVTL